MQEQEEKQKNVMKAWKCKADELKESNILLKKSFDNAINNEFESVLNQIESKSVNAIKLVKEESTHFSNEAVNERRESLNAFEEEYQSLLSTLKNQAAEMNEEYKEGIQALDLTTHEIIEKQNKNNHIFENGKFLFSNLMMVVIAVILIRALFFGIWEGFRVNLLYEWASQWDGLKYTLWTLFTLIIGTVVYYAYTFLKILKNNINRP